MLRFHSFITIIVPQHISSAVFEGAFKIYQTILALCTLSIAQQTYLLSDDVCFEFAISYYQIKCTKEIIITFMKHLKINISICDILAYFVREMNYSYHFVYITCLYICTVNITAITSVAKQNRQSYKALNCYYFCLRQIHIPNCCYYMLFNMLF